MEKVKNILHRITESYAFLLFVMTLSQALNFIFKSFGAKGGPKGGHAWPSAGAGGAGVGAMGGAGTTGSSQTSAIAGGTGGSGGPSGTDGPGRPGGKGDPGWPIKTSTSIQSNIKKAINAEPEIRTELVKKYKDQIKSGEYKIDTDEVASKMISDALEEDLT